MTVFLDCVAHANEYSRLPSLEVLIIVTTTLCLYQIYRLALPKPIPGIPYNESSARKLFGDLPAMISHVSKADGTFATYMLSTMKSLDAPLVQVFVRPFSKPLLVLSDFRETQDLLVHRKEFDRSSNMGDLVKGLAPDHHIHLKTNAAWKSQRRLVQDLMTPSFLHNVAGPAIHQNASVLIELWRVKARIADGRPFEAAADTNHAALDAVMSFGFGERFNDTATRPVLEALKQLDEKAVKTIRHVGGHDKHVQFPTGQLDEVLQAILDLAATIGELQGSLVPRLTWAYLLRKPRIKRAMKIKSDYILKELKNAVERSDGSDGDTERSAVSHMMLREKSFASKAGRKPDYFSGIMLDEIFGFIFGGHETTSTTICWGLKILADNAQAQAKLRIALQTSFAAAKLEGSNPTIQDITGAHIPYLDATLEELQRCSGTSPIIDRQAVADTELLGYHIPKDTVVACLTMGPSMMTPGFEIDEARRNLSSQAVKKEGRERTWDPEDMSDFKPERWLVRGEKGEEFDASAGPQLGFGLGTRGCYGKRLAYLEMRILFTLILWNFELLPCPPALSGYSSVIISTNRPKDCYVCLREVELRKE